MSETIKKYEFLDITGVEVLKEELEKVVVSSEQNANEYTNDKITALTNTYYTETEIDGKVSALQESINNKSEKTHNHDSVYSKLEHKHEGDYSDIDHNHDNTYSKLGHTHTIDSVTNLQSSLDAKVNKTVTVNGKELSGNIKLTASDVGADVSGTASSTVNIHNTSTSAHNDIRSLISDLNKKVTNFLDVDETTTDQLSEILALIEANADDIDKITSGKINVSDIVNNLTTNVSNKPLSASQGVALKGLIDKLQEEVDGKSDTSHTHEIYASTVQTTGSGNAITSITQDGNTITAVKGSTFLTAHPTVSKVADDTSAASPKHGGTFTVIDNITRDSNGHVTNINTKTITLPSETTLSKGTDATGKKTLEYGKTFTAITDTSVSGHKITDTTTTFTMPSVDSALSETSTNPVQNKTVKFALDSKANKETGVFYIEGNGTVEGVWTGSHSDIGEYYSGLMIAFKLNIGGVSGGSTLNINNFGAIAVKMNSTTAVTTHYSVNSILFLVYTVDSDGSAYWKVADYNSDKKVSQYSTTTDNKYPMLFKYDAGNTSTSTKTNYVRFNNNLYVNPSTGVIYAKKFDGDLVGNADSASAVKTSSGNVTIWKGTKAQYNAITTKDENCLYIVVDDIPKQQTWTLTLTDGSVVERKVVVYD